MAAGAVYAAVPANAGVQIDSAGRCVLDLSVDDTCSTAMLESNADSPWLLFVVTAENNTAWKLVDVDTGAVYDQGHGSVYSKTDGHRLGRYQLILTRDPNEHSGRAEALLTDD